jgi:hypothetical protein
MYPKKVSVHPSYVVFMGLVPEFDLETASSRFTAVANNEQEEMELQKPHPRTLLEKMGEPGTIPPPKQEPLRLVPQVPLYDPRKEPASPSRSSLVQEPDQLKKLVTLVEGLASRA